MPTSTIVRAPLLSRCLRLDVAVLTRPGKQVLATMANYADPDGSRCFPSAATIARETGLHRVTVAGAIGHLRRIGALIPVGGARAALRQARAARHSIEYRISIDHLPATDHPRRTGGQPCSPPLQGHVARDCKGMSSGTTSPSQKTEPEERGGGEPPPPPISTKQSEARATSREDHRQRLRRLCARLGYSTRPDAIDELLEWLKGLGFVTWGVVEDFLTSAARRASQEAKGRGLYLRDVRPHYATWDATDPAVVLA